ncbi:ABC transporter ATP-binding protein [Rubrobacter calidifluminis]|uniref:ABC transporter ATP-binding protein n=1 Tax=Rubrobacter calidifluminis TaxID=1392640 RepID=UPI00235E2FE4|nr:ATP-binding cassette domain-containing protein [Rubrobacter calidifluminis]
MESIPRAETREDTRATVLARNLRKSYDEFEAVRGIDFEVRRGECFGFLGPNGAGKTSTMRMIYCSAVPTGGTLEVVGLDVRRDEREVKRRIGVVPQENNLDDDLKVRENLIIYGRYFDLPKKVIERRVDELLEFMELKDKADSEVEHLSGGMKRRLVIARALVNDPDLLILDEPTTGLDPQARHLVWERLRELAARGKTLILTTHYMEEAARLCDRLVIMWGGRIISEGTPEELIERHVSPQVLEFNADAGTLEALSRLLEEDADAVEYGSTRDTLLVYTQDAEPVLEKVRASGLEAENTTYRRADLEDVFLRLTGRRLTD